MKIMGRRRMARKGDGISAMLDRRASEARGIADALRSGRLKGITAEKAEKRMETITLDAHLLWRIRQRMVEIAHEG